MATGAGAPTSRPAGGSGTGRGALLSAELAGGAPGAVRGRGPGEPRAGDHFEGAHEPPGLGPAKTARRREDFTALALDKGAGAAVGFSGDATPGRLAAESPDLAPVMGEAGGSPVAVDLLGPRLPDPSPLATLGNAGFRPRATALVRNEGRADPTAPRAEEFARTVRHSAYRAAVERGAVELWMPRLFCAKEVEDRRVKFEQAAGAVSPDGRRVAPLGPFDRSRVRHWLERMEVELAPLASWLP